MAARSGTQYTDSHLFVCGLRGDHCNMDYCLMFGIRHFEIEGVTALALPGTAG
jgi:hypothetical protein